MVCSAAQQWDLLGVYLGGTHCCCWSPPWCRCSLMQSTPRHSLLLLACGGCCCLWGCSHLPHAAAVVLFLLLVLLPCISHVGGASRPAHLYRCCWMTSRQLATFASLQHVGGEMRCWLVGAACSSFQHGPLHRLLCALPTVAADLPEWLGGGLSQQPQVYSVRVLSILQELLWYQGGRP
jgi:hypothetical protein